MARGIPVYPHIPDVRVSDDRTDEERIHAVLLEIRDAVVKESKADRWFNGDAMWRKESPGPLAITGGSLIGDMSMGPEKACSMSVRNISTAGYSAGTVTVSRVNGVVIATFGANGGSVFYAKRQIWLEENDRLVVTAAGITGAPTIYFDSDEMKNWYVPTYIS